MFVVAVKTSAGKTITLRLHHMWTVKESKCAIQDQEGTPPDLQLLLLEGKRLEDGQTLGNYNIKQASTLHLLLRL